jgi:spore maturation protein CgeB
VKVALIADSLTSDALSLEANLYSLTPLNYRFVLKFFKVDFLFVESAWQGHKNKWKFKIASYKDYPQRNNKRLQNVVTYAKKLGIPTVFWNKEDGVHFDRFIDSAKLFDHIFTVDENCIPRYKKALNDKVTVNTLMFAVQHRFHNFTGFNFKEYRANFAGSYSYHVHIKRKAWQDMMFGVASSSELGIDIYDRNYDRKSINYRYPRLLNMETKPAVKYADTAQIYKDYLVSLNVNTIENSATMYSRRLVEIIACGGIAITNDSAAVQKYFKDYCYVVHTSDEMFALCKRLKDGPSALDLARSKAGADYVAEHHTWEHRLNEIRKIIGI